MTVTMIPELIVIFFILLGTLLSLLSSLGFIRLPDVYTRLHAATKSSTLGLLCILFGAFFYFWFTEGHISIRLILGIVFIFITAPVSGHMVARSAYRSGVSLADISVKDDLDKALAKQQQAKLNSESKLDSIES